MPDIYIQENYASIEKPFTLTGRSHESLGETEYWDIAYLNAFNAKLLHQHGIPWRSDKEPDWEKHDNRIALMKAKKQKFELDKRIAELEATTVTPATKSAEAFSEGGKPGPSQKEIEG
jgi:hypothetical protein